MNDKSGEQHNLISVVRMRNCGQSSMEMEKKAAEEKRSITNEMMSR